MAIKTYRPITPTLRFKSTVVNDDLTTNRPHKPLTKIKQRTGGRRNAGDITMWHRGGGHKRKIRTIDFKRDKSGVPATVATIEYDPNRSARIALLNYADGAQRRAQAGQGRANGSLRRWTSATGRERRRMGPAQAAFRRDPSRAHRLH